VIAAVLGAPGSGKSTVARQLRPLLPGHVVVDWDDFMAPATALAGRDIRRNPDTWPAYSELVRAVLATMAHLPVVMLGVSTPDEFPGLPIATWFLLDCTDQERQRRLDQAGRLSDLRDAIDDAREYRALGFPVIDTTTRAPAEVAAELAELVQLL
jgi:broad-specificity NMP kinase